MKREREGKEEETKRNRQAERHPTNMAHVSTILCMYVPNSTSSFYFTNYSLLLPNDHSHYI